MGMEHIFAPSSSPRPFFWIGDQERMPEKEVWRLSFHTEALHAELYITPKFQGQVYVNNGTHHLN